MAVASRFPVVRADRGVGTSGTSALAAATGGGTPRTREFTFMMRTAAQNTRSSASSPLINGPALIKQLRWKYFELSDLPRIDLTLGVAPAPVTESGVAITDGKSFRSLFEPIFGPGNVFNPGEEGTTQGSAQNSFGLQLLDLDYIITDAQFHLVCTQLQTVAGGGANVWASVSVVEGLSIEALRNFL